MDNKFGIINEMELAAVDPIKLNIYYKLIFIFLTVFN